MLKKNNIGKITTIGFGAALLGATAFGAGAAGLSDFPSPFVSGGAINGNTVIAYGDNADTRDATGAQQIFDYFSGLTGGKTSGGGGSTLLELGSNAFAIQQDDDSYPELGNWEGSGTEEYLGSTSTLGGVRTEIIEEDLALLSDGSLDDNSYEQSITLGQDKGEVVYNEMDDVLGTFLKYAEDDTIFTYKATFDGSGAESTIESTVLEDFVDEDITILGKTYTITEANVEGDSGNNVSLVLAAGAETKVLRTGSSDTIGGKAIQVGSIYDNADGDKEVDLTVGGVLKSVKAGETEDFDLNDFEISIREIRTLGDSGEGSIEIDFGADRIRLDATSSNTNNVEVEVDGKYEKVGADFSVSGSHDDDTYTIESFQIVFKANDNYYIQPGQGLQSYNEDSGEAFLEEGLGSLMGNLNIIYHGLSSEETQEVSFDHSDDGQQYYLNFIDGGGNPIKMPLVFSDDEDNRQFSLGSEDDALVLGPGNTRGSSETINPIGEDDYFLVGSSSDKETYLFRVVSMEYDDDDNEGTVTIRDVGSKEDITIDLPELAHNSNTDLRAFRFGGNSYTLSATLTSDSDSTPQLMLKAIHNEIYLSNGQNLDISVGGDGVNARGFIFPPNHDTQSRDRFIAVTLETSDADTYDNIAPANVVVNFTGTVSSTTDAAGELGEDLSVKVTDSDDLKKDPDNKDLKTGYTSFGTFISYDTSDSDGKVITLTTPDSQIRPLVVLEGAQGASSVSTTSTPGGSSPSVSVTTVRPASQVGNYENFNTILIGGPCVNPLTSSALGVGSSPGECTTGFQDGSAMIRYIEHGNGNVALVVAGYSTADTSRAVEALTQTPRNNGLTGHKVTVSAGPSGSDVIVTSVG